MLKIELPVDDKPSGAGPVSVDAAERRKIADELSATEQQKAAEEAAFYAILSAGPPL